MNVFILYAKKFWQHKRSVIRRHVIQSVMRHPEVNAVVSGPGWVGYDNSVSLQANINRELGHADVVWIYKADGNPGLGIPAVKGLESVDALRVTRFHEFWWVNEPKMAAQAKKETENIDLILYTHANDADRFAKFGVKALHIPQTCDESLFWCDTPVSQRPIPCLLTGTLGREHYPFRVRLASLIRSGKIPGEIRKAPPCWVDDAQKEVVAYAQHLKRSQIVLGCTSKWKYALGKQVEAAMSGCVVGTDMPDDPLFSTTIGKYALELNPAWPDGEIVRSVKGCLADLEMADRRAECSQREALKFTNTEYANRFVECVKGEL